MDINEEIAKIIEYQNSSLLLQNRKNEATIKSIIEQVCKDYKDGNYDFSKFRSIPIKQMGKVRHTKTFEPFSCEETLCIYLKRTLDRKLQIKYPNRNEYVRSLFDVISALRDMNNYSILRFDFKDFFNTVSSEYVFDKYISKYSLERYQIELLKDFVTKTKYAYAGLNTSNIICETISKHFDELLFSKFEEQGLIFYRRYIDDGILVFNKHVEYNLCLSTINDAIREIFLDKNIDVEKGCKTQLNDLKTKFVSSYTVSSSNSKADFDFLGYNFVLSPKGSENKKNKPIFKYGITQDKMDKYSKRIDDIIEDYLSHKNVELLRHQIKAFSFRTVYQVPKYKSLIWKAKGFIANYQELRFRTDMLTDDTKDFLENSIINAFTKKGVDLPYFLKGNKEESIYNLYNNLINYRTLLFVELIGIDKKTLVKMCEQIGIRHKKKRYDGLVRDYLIKVKIGH